MTGTDDIGDVRRGFDDNLAAALFKRALIERYCREEISVRAVEQSLAENASTEKPHKQA